MFFKVLRYYSFRIFLGAADLRGGDGVAAAGNVCWRRQQ